MKQEIKKKILTFVMIFSMAGGVFASSNVTAFAASTTATTATTTKSTSAAVSGGGTTTTQQQSTETTYVLNTNTKKFHYPSCKDVKKIKEKNYATSTSSRDDIVAQGYSPCGHCHP